MIGILEALVFAVFAGLVGSIVGIGGSLILTPVLVFFGVPIQYAIGASMVAIVATSSGSASSYVRDGLSNIRAAFYLEIFTAVGAIIGAVVTSYLVNGQTRYLYFFFAAFLLTSFYGIFSRKGGRAVAVQPDSLARSLKLEGTYFDKQSGTQVTYSLTRPLLAAPGMVVAGIAAGMLGIGAGAFKTSVQEIVMGMPTKVASATSNFIIGMTALAGASVYIWSGLVYVNLAAVLAIGTTIGSFGGARVLPRMTNRSVRLLFMVVLVILIVEMLFKGVSA
ncbi:MAG: sulfite exporter TauE/SafE family protein [Thaumarchaeota archaeon]|nr:sulfite exporter TauE/SafE family protein [Nitrososphaerota archaeon]